MLRIKAFLCILIFTVKITKDSPRQFVVWAVGQGSFSTLLKNDICLHIDMGGEFFPYKKLRRACRDKKNYLLLTHFDYDHRNFVHKFIRHVTELCSLTIIPKKYKNTFSFRNLTLCQDKPLYLYKVLYIPKFKMNNDSYIYLIDKHIFISGDAPSKVERRLSTNHLDKIRIFLVGHHGSRTSSSRQLLRQMQRHPQAIVSARKSRYGHPHEIVLRRSREHFLPVLTTEAYGHITIELD